MAYNGAAGVGHDDSATETDTTLKVEIQRSTVSTDGFHSQFIIEQQS